jgi:hypothetical protein
LNAQFCAEFDPVLAEEFSKSRTPKTEVHRKTLGDDLSRSSEELSVIVTDWLSDTDIPQFTRGDTASVANLIAENFTLKIEGKAFPPPPAKPYI